LTKVRRSNLILPESIWYIRLTLNKIHWLRVSIYIISSEKLFSKLFWWCRNSKKNSWNDLIPIMVRHPAIKLIMLRISFKNATWSSLQTSSIFMRGVSPFRLLIIARASSLKESRSNPPTTWKKWCNDSLTKYTSLHDKQLGYISCQFLPKGCSTRHICLQLLFSKK